MCGDDWEFPRERRTVSVPKTSWNACEVVPISSHPHPHSSVLEASFLFDTLLAVHTLKIMSFLLTLVVIRQDTDIARTDTKIDFSTLLHRGGVPSLFQGPTSGKSRTWYGGDHSFDQANDNRPRPISLCNKPRCPIAKLFSCSYNSGTSVVRGKSPAS